MPSNRSRWRRAGSRRLFGIAEVANFSASTCNPLTAHWLKVFPPNQLSAANVSFTTQTCAST